MKLRSMLLGLVLAIVLAAPAFAQTGISTGTSSGTGSTSGGTVPDLPGLGATGLTSDAAADTAGVPGPRRAARPAADTSAPTKLPKTGGPVAGYALLGIALVAGGRLLMELTPRATRS